MKYTEIPDWYEEIYLDKFKYGTGDKPPFSMKLARSDPTIFGYYMISSDNMKMRIYQSFILDCITANLVKDCAIKFPGKFYYNPKLDQIIDLVGVGRKKFILCLGRQVGKSTLLKLLSFWATYFNITPSGTTNETKAFVISRGDDQAKELLGGIRSMIRQGDMNMAMVTKFTKNHDVNWLSKKIIEPNNTQQITFKNGFGANSYIKSVPPTEAIIGKSADWLIGDEFAKLGCSDPDNWFNEAADPTTIATNGITVLNSTPNGQSGIFYNIFDPEDIKSNHQYYRIWFPYSINKESEYQDVAKQNKERLLSDDKRKEWEQEYEAKFTTAVSSFFNSQSVDDSVDSTLSEVYASTKPTSLGIDYGMVNTQTSFSVSDNLTLLRQIVYPKGDTGLTWFEDICSLVTDYNAEFICVDDCIDKDTEIMVKHKQSFVPKKICEVKVGDLVQSFDFNTNKYTTEKVYGSFDKGMLETNKIKLRNGTILYATDDHKFWVRNNQSGKISYKKFKDLNNQRDRLILTRNPVWGKCEKQFNEAKTYLIGMYVAEGSHHVGENRCFIAQDKGINDEKRDKIQECLDMLGIRYTKSKKGFSLLSGQDIVKEFQSYGTYCDNKKLPEEVFNYGYQQLLVLFEGLLDGDGWKNNRKQDINGKTMNLEYGYTTTSHELAKQMMELSRRLSKPFYMTYRERENKKPCWDLTYNKNSWFNKNYGEGISQVGWEVIGREKRPVWDIAVENTNTFILYESGLIIHNCPEGYTINNQLIQKYGEYPQGKVIKIGFRGMKISMFDAFRKKLVNKEVHLIKIDPLIIQMKGMKIEQLQTNIRITKGSGMMDDRVDSLIMSMYPSLNNEPVQETGLNYGDPYNVEVITEFGELRGDKQWQKIKETTKDNKELLRLWHMANKKQ